MAEAAGGLQWSGMGVGEKGGELRGSGSCGEGAGTAVWDMEGAVRELGMDRRGGLERGWRGGWGREEVK